MNKRNSPSDEVATVADHSQPEECFVIMPISDQNGYEQGHFSRVYEDLFKPACAAAGYRASRADEVKESNLIHLDILKRVVHAPMAICDLSSRNPNVLFELGLRQAFDKPTVLVKDSDTPDIFDIAPIRYTPYRQALRYREVLADQKAISEALLSTRDATGTAHNVNSLIRLLEIQGPAKIVENAGADPKDYFQILMAEVSQLRREIKSERMLPPIPRVSKQAPASRAARVREKVALLETLAQGGVPTGIFREAVQEALDTANEAIMFYSNSNASDSRNGEKLKMVLDEREKLHKLLES